MKRESVSAIIPVHNSAKYIEETIKSLLNQSVKFDEIIIVDSASTDNTVEVITKFKQVKLIHLDVDVERIVTRNVGWKAAKGNIIAFVDSDLVLVKDWLKEVLKGFDQGHIAVVDRRAVENPTTYIAKMNDHFFDVRFTDRYRPFTAWVIRRDVLEKLGWLDESIIGFEDIDLGDRLYSAGHKIYFAKNAIAYHKGEPKNFETEMRRHFWFGSHALPYWKKKKPKKKPIRVTFFLLLTILLVIKPLWSLATIFLLYGYVFLKDALYFHMKLKYLFVHPFIAVASEFAYAYGFVYSLVRGPMKYARSSDADVAKVTAIK